MSCGLIIIANRVGTQMLQQLFQQNIAVRKRNLSTACMRGVLFDPVVGGSPFLRDFGKRLTYYAAS
jgi:hypothetical protein